MAYGLKFTCAYNNDLNELISINIEEDGFTGSIKNLTADDACLVIKSTTGDQDKMQPVCGTEATIRLRIGITDNVDITDFIATADNTFRVTCMQEGRIIFQGFVVVEDNYRPFLDPPFVIQIRAMDCLGILQGTYFLDALGNPFSGKMTVIGWLAQILNQTGQTLNLRTYFNIFNSSEAVRQIPGRPLVQFNGNPLEQIALDAITFQTGQQTPAGDINPADFNTGFDDYYTVLEKIVRNLRCKIFQEAGCWHLVNMWEYLNPAGFSYFEYSFGAPVNGIVPYTQVTKASNLPQAVTIGKNDTLRLIAEDSLLYLKLQTKSVEFTFNYNQSLNKIINQDLSQGVAQPAQNEVISSAIIDTSFNGGVAVNLQTKAFQAFGYGLQQSASNAQAAVDPANSTPSAASNGFIRIVYDQLNNEIVRFLVLKILTSSGSGPAAFFQTSPVLIDQNDIFQMSFSWRTRSGTGIANNRWILGMVLLTGDDGTFWALSSLGGGGILNNPCIWVKTNAAWRNSSGAIQVFTSDSINDTRIWTNVGVNNTTINGSAFAIAPTSGSLQVILLTTIFPGDEYWFKDLSITILPYLNGSYAQLKGDYNYAESTANIKATDLETVDISDSPKRYFQGALLSSATGNPLLAATWSRLAYGDVFRFTQLMAYIVYTHIYRIVQKMEGTVKGLSYQDSTSPIGVSPSGIRNIFFFTDSKTPTKAFMLCSFEKDYNTGTWRGVFIETRSDQNDPGLKVPDFYEFSYLFTGL